jgi:hypothetical protein
MNEQIAGCCLSLPLNIGAAAVLRLTSTWPALKIVTRSYRKRFKIHPVPLGFFYGRFWVARKVNGLASVFEVLGVAVYFPFFGTMIFIPIICNSCSPSRLRKN